MVLKCKRVSYGLVELYDNGTTWARYCIRVNGSIHEVSDEILLIKSPRKTSHPKNYPFGWGIFIFRWYNENWSMLPQHLSAPVNPL